MAPREARSVAVLDPAAAEAGVELSLGLSIGSAVALGGAAARGESNGDRVTAAAEDRAAMEAAAAISRAGDRAAREAEPISGVRRSAATAAASSAAAAAFVQFPHVGFLPSPNPNSPGPYIHPYHHPQPQPHPHHQQVQYAPALSGFRFKYVAPCWSPAPPAVTAAAARAAGAVGGTGIAVNHSAAEGGCATASPGNSPRTGSSSSDVSDRQSGSVQGSSDWSQTRSHSSTSLTEKPNSSTSQSSLTNGLNTNTTTPTTNTSTGNKKPISTCKEHKQEDPPLPRMPCVTTTGNGPDGRTVTGFLYRYTKSEVRILCICHGKSFSPAEFLEHAGATDVTQPLRRIVVVPA